MSISKVDSRTKASASRNAERSNSSPESTQKNARATTSKKKKTQESKQDKRGVKQANAQPLSSSSKTSELSSPPPIPTNVAINQTKLKERQDMFTGGASNQIVTQTPVPMPPGDLNQTDSENAVRLKEHSPGSTYWQRGFLEPEVDPQLIQSGQDTLNGMGHNLTTQGKYFEDPPSGFGNSKSFFKPNVKPGQDFTNSLTTQYLDFNVLPNGTGVIQNVTNPDEPVWPPYYTGAGNLTGTPTNFTKSASSDGGGNQKIWNGPATNLFYPSPQEVKDNIHYNSNHGLADGNKLTPAQSGGLNNTIDTLDNNGYDIADATFKNGELSLSAIKDYSSGEYPGSTVDGSISQDILIYENGGTHNDTVSSVSEFNPNPKQ